MAHDIFISHSSKDKTIADAVCATFEANGIRCWVAPRDVPPGAAWGAAIVDAIQKSRVMVLIFSENANTSGQIAREVERAADYGVTIVPIRVEDVAPAQSLQYFLSNIHWLDALSPPLERRLQEIVAKIQPMLGERTGSAPIVTPKLPAQPTPAGKQWWLPGIATVILLAAAILVWRGYSRPIEKKESIATPAAAPSSVPAQVAVDPALVGNWSYVTTLLDAEVHIEVSIDAGSRYTFRTFLKGDGTVRIKDGKGTVIDQRTGKTISTRYSFSSDDQLVWISPTADPNVHMTLNYKRTGGRRIPAEPLVGKWHATTLYTGLMWDADWEIQPDSSYQFLFENTDEGTLTATHGTWESSSQLGRPSGKGFYRNVTPDSFEMSHPVFQLLRFERVSPKSGR